LGDQSRRMRWAGHVAGIGEGSGVYRVLVWKPEERDNFEDPGVDGMIISIWVFRKWNGGAWDGLIWLRIGIGGGLL